MREGSPARVRRGRSPWNLPVGRRRGRRLWLFWDKLGVLALGPRTSIAPAHPFAQEDTSDLRTRDLYTPLLCGLGESIQRPVSFPLLIEGFELSSTAAYQPSGRLRSGQSDDLRAFQLREAWLASGTRTISESVYPSALKRWSGFLTVLGWQLISSAILAVRSPCQLKEMILARKIQSPGAWRLPTSLWIFFCSSASSGWRAQSSFGTFTSPSRSAVRPRAYVYRL
jgi:hypothetical protein